MKVLIKFSVSSRPWLCSTQRLRCKARQLGLFIFVEGVGKQCKGSFKAVRFSELLNYYKPSLYKDSFKVTTPKILKHINQTISFRVLPYLNPKTL